MKLLKDSGFDRSNILTASLITTDVAVREDGRTARIEFGESSTEIFNLSTEVDEELFSLDEIMRQIVGDDWRELLAAQLERQKGKG